MRVLVTGASGLVGRAIVGRLGQDGFETVGLNRGLAQTETEQHSVDISGPSFFEETIRSVPRCAAVVHAAACLDEAPHSSGVALTNCLGTQNVLRLARHWEVDSFVYISSIAVIGRPVTLPITEDHPVVPGTAYHASKLYGEYLTGIAARSGLNGSILRITAPIGPGMPQNRILAVFLGRARQGLPLMLFGQGTRRQNYVDVRDVAQAVSRCIQSRFREACNIGGARSISNVELAALCVEAAQSSSQVLFSGEPDLEEGTCWDVSIERARRKIGYEPEYDVVDTMRDLGTKN